LAYFIGACARAVRWKQLVAPCLALRVLADALCLGGTSELERGSRARKSKAGRASAKRRGLTRLWVEEASTKDVTTAREGKPEGGEAQEGIERCIG
jgi:hypothetical protein